MKEMMKINFSSFINLYKDYQSGRKDEEDMTHVCTQPFWHSLKRSRDRLYENGLTMEFEYKDERYDSLYKRIYITDTLDMDKVEVTTYDKQANYDVGFTKKRLKVSKAIKKNGEVIYKEDEDMIVCTDQIKRDGESTYVECPNCGYIDTESGFIGGCKQCGSPYLVDPNELKVSSFYMKNDNEKLISRKFTALSKIAKLAAKLIFAGLIVLSTIWLALSFTTEEVNYLVGETIFMGTAILLLVLGFLLCLVIANITRWIYYDNHSFTRVSYSPFSRELMETIPGFTKEKFAQNLEMILRNIHMTNKPQDVNVFANMDMTEIVNGYSDVIDCSLNDMRFEAFKKEPSRYILVVTAGMNLYRYDGENITKEYEGLKLTFSGDRNMVMDNISAVCMYKCDSCGSTINLLKGGVCEYCGSRLAYEKYYFILQNYIIKEKAMPKEKKIRRKIVAVFGVSFLLVAWLVIKFMFGLLE